MSNLYLLNFPDNNAIKIGKANNIQRRIDDLKSHWGTVDYNNSYYLKGDEKYIFKLEKTLHFLVKDFRIKELQGDGKTEMFNQTCLPNLLNHLNFICESQDVEIIKGIKNNQFKPVPRVKNPNNLQKLSEKHLMLKWYIPKYRKLKKLLNFLIKHHKSIKYQYVFEREHLFFSFSESVHFYVDFTDENDSFGSLFHYNSCFFKKGFSYKGQHHYCFKIPALEYNGKLICTNYLELVTTLKQGIPSRSPLLKCDLIDKEIKNQLLT